MVPTILYARQSRYRGESESIPTQLEVGRDAAPRLGLEIVAELVDKVSAYKRRGLDRPEWQRLLEMIRRGEAKAILVYKSERLSRRGGPGWAPLLEAAEQAGLDLDRLVATPQGFMSEFEIGIRATMDREEAKKIGSRMADLREKEAKAGKPTYGGPRPWGFAHDRVAHDPAEAEQVREAARRLLDGDTLYRIARDVGRGRHVVREALLSPRMAGLRTHRGNLYPALWEPILDRDTWEAVGALIRTNKDRPAVRRTGASLLSGLLRCGRCGGNLHHRDGRRYVCVNQDLSRAADGIEREVVAHVLAYRHSHLEQPPVDPALTAAVRGYEARLADAREMFMEGALTKQEYLALKGDLETKLRDAEQRLADATRAEVPIPPEAAIVFRGEEYVDERRAAWLNLTPAQQRLLVRSVVTEVVVHPTGRGRRTFDPGAELTITLRPELEELGDDEAA